MGRALFWLALLILVVIGSVYALAGLGVHGIPPTFWKESLIFLAASFALMFIYLARARTDVFLYLYLASMVIKLLAFAGYNIWVILEDKEHAPANVIFFLLVYLVLTTWEVVALFRRSNR